MYPNSILKWYFIQVIGIMIEIVCIYYLHEMRDIFFYWNELCRKLPSSILKLTKNNMQRPSDVHKKRLVAVSSVLFFPKLKLDSIFCLMKKTEIELNCDLID